MTSVVAGWVLYFVVCEWGGPRRLLRARTELRGVVDLDRSLAGRIPRDAIVFVTVRDLGWIEGPPLAVKRLLAGRFPLPFTIGPADSMLRRPLSHRYAVCAVLDNDGDPLTHEPGEPRARVDVTEAAGGVVWLALR